MMSRPPPLAWFAARPRLQAPALPLAALPEEQRGFLLAFVKVAPMASERVKWTFPGTRSKGRGRRARPGSSSSSERLRWWQPLQAMQWWQGAW